MTSEKLLSEELRILRKGKGEICISIIVPTHRLSPERREDHLVLKKAIDNATELLETRYSESNIQPLLQAMNELYQGVDFSHNLDGLGFYISPYLKLVVKFPFPVEEKVFVSDNFELRDLLYKINYAKPYFVLVLSEKEIRLFECSVDDVIEVKDSTFPQKYQEEYLYSPPSRGTSFAGSANLKGFEKDKSELEAIRFTDFFRHADGLLSNYLQDDSPLMVLGNEKALSWFGNVTKHRTDLITKIEGDYIHAAPKEIADIIRPAILLNIDQENANLIKEFSEKIGQGLGVSGIQEVWQAANEGRALKLLVEKDFHCPGFLDRNGNKLYLSPPQVPHKILADAVDDLIETVIEKQGNVFFTESYQLKDYERIGLITRY